MSDRKIVNGTVHNFTVCDGEALLVISFPWPQDPEVWFKLKEIVTIESLDRTDKKQ